MMARFTNSKVNSIQPTIDEDELPLSAFSGRDRFKRASNLSTPRCSLQRRATAPSIPSSDQPTQPSHETNTPHRYKRKVGPYTLTKTLGAGSMGKVKLGIHETTGHKVAVKIIPRKVKPPDNFSLRRGDDSALADRATEDKRVMREVSILFLLHHPFVVKMEDFMVTPHHYYLMFEYVEGGQLLDYIIAHGKLNERTARKFSRQILSALDYCHRNSIVHRDLKIENILISNAGSIKIIDFGLSNLYSSKSHLSTFCGSLYFAAPELLSARAYTGPEVDIWSFGVVLYVLMCGEVPFDDKSMTIIHHKIKKGVVKYPSWLSPDCRHLLSRILVTNPAERATMVEILQHPWINKGFPGPPDSYFPLRMPLSPVVDPEVIKHMTGFQFGTFETIRQRVEKSIAEFNGRPLHATSSPKFPHKGSRDVQTPISYPYLSIYYLVKEKLEREAQEIARPVNTPSIEMSIPEEEAPESNLSRSRSCKPVVVGSSGWNPSVSPRVSYRKPSETSVRLCAPENGMGNRNSGIKDPSSPLRWELRGDPGPPLQPSTQPGTSENTCRPVSVAAAAQAKRNSVPASAPLPSHLEVPVSETAHSKKGPQRKPSRLERIGHLLARGTSLREHKLSSAKRSPALPEEPLSPASVNVPRVTASIQPVFIKGLFSVSSTSTKKPSVIRKEILRALAELGLAWREQEGYISVVKPILASSVNPTNSPPPAASISNDGSFAPSAGSRDGTIVLPAPEVKPPSRTKSLKQRFLRKSPSLIKRSAQPTSPLSTAISNSPLPPLRFEIQIVKLSLFRLHGIKFRRLAGDPWSYKDICSQILRSLKL
ncbi:Serine/threonine-protein kinase [Massospora cicadina]|nr:Serine/threonine-protein kinase [Massospora cicadina]